MLPKVGMFPRRKKLNDFGLFFRVQQIQVEIIIFIKNKNIKNINSNNNNNTNNK